MSERALMLAFAAIIGGELLNTALQSYLPIPVASISSFSIFAVLYVGFDRWGWKAPLLRRVVPTPVIDGGWVGEIESSYSPNEDEDDLSPIESDGSTLTITQRWSTIEIHYRNPDSSHSRSTMAHIFTKQGSQPEVSYTYKNEPEGAGREIQNPHSGTAGLRITTNDKGEKVLVGKYYTDQPRRNYGNMRFEKISSEERTS